MDERLGWIKEMKKTPLKAPEIKIGKNTIIHPTASLGTDGFTWARKKDGSFEICPNYGDVIIEDNVRIGPYCVIRRSTLPGTATIIGDGTVLLSFVLVGHNCKIGKNNVISNFVELDGSVEVGDRCNIAPHASIRHRVRINDDAKVGMGAIVVKDVPLGTTVAGVPANPIEYRDCYVSDDFQHGENFEIGRFSVIEPDVNVGDNVKIGHHCLLKSGTRFGDNIDFSDYCKTTGICYVGNDVNIRTGSCISKSMIIEDKVFVGAGIMSSHTKYIHHHRPNVEKRQHITRIGYGSVIGSCTNLSAGVRVGDNVIVGYDSLVTRDILEPAIYIGKPTRKFRDLPSEYHIIKPSTYEEHQFPLELLEKYLPYYGGKK